MGQQLYLTSRVRIRKDVLYHDLQGEVVILDLNSELYFGLNPVGTRIWHFLEERGSLQRVVNSLVEEYDVTRARCADDLLGFVAQMLEKGLLEVSNGGAS